MYIEDVFGPTQCHIQIRVDWETIHKLGLELTIHDIKHAIVHAKKLKLKKGDVRIRDGETIRIYMTDDVTGGDIWSTLQRYMRDLPHVIVKVLPCPRVLQQGYPSIGRAVITEIDKRPGHYQLLVEGYGIRDVMNTDGIVGTKTTTNHVADMRTFLGIEAARQSIINEVQYTMSMCLSYGANG
jgi:DNA-directed RNA polymerase III subunit RPC1